MQWGMSCEGKDCQNWKRNENNFVSFEATHLTQLGLGLGLKFNLMLMKPKCSGACPVRGKIVRTENGMKITVLVLSYTPNPN